MVKKLVLAEFPQIASGRGNIPCPGNECSPTSPATSTKTCYTESSTHSGRTASCETSRKSPRHPPRHRRVRRGGGGTKFRKFIDMILVGPTRGSQNKNPSPCGIIIRRVSLPLETSPRGNVMLRGLLLRRCSSTGRANGSRGHHAQRRETRAEITTTAAASSRSSRARS